MKYALSTFSIGIIIILVGIFLYALLRLVAVGPFTQLGLVKFPFLSSTLKNSHSTSPIVLKETGSKRESASGTFWLNSGGMFYLSGNGGSTIQGNLPTYSPWRLAYASSNPTDTDNGYHPQNIFRLITNEEFKDFTEEVYVNIVKDNLSTSENRNMTNGVFLIGRYHDANNLYYAGIRVDGTLVIKRKSNGVYHTLGQINYFDGDPYDHNKHPSLLPKGIWMGVKMEIKNTDTHTVKISLSVDKDGTGHWSDPLNVQDTFDSNNEPILTAGAGGIRSDFMDLEFKDFKIDSQNSPLSFADSS